MWYRPKVVDRVEAFHWIDERNQGGLGPRDYAAVIVEWIKSQGVEATFIRGYRIPECFGARQPDEILIKTAGVPGGAIRARLGDYIVQTPWIHRTIEDSAETVSFDVVKANMFEDKFVPDE